MKCDKCNKGRVLVWTEYPLFRLDPCPQCHGSGITACCEGLCEQPGEDADRMTEEELLKGLEPLTQDHAR